MLPDPRAEIILLGPVPLLDGGLPILELDVAEEPLAYRKDISIKVHRIHVDDVVVLKEKARMSMRVFYLD